jgi:hypothetical protein
MDYPTIEESNKASLNVSRLSEMQIESMEGADEPLI